jgi:hypothetical protein
MATMQERVAERYPALVPLLRQPEIGRLLTQAVENNWSAGVFQSKFMASNWFRSQSESQRRWWITTATDPGEAKLQRNQYSADIIKTANSLGVNLNSAQVKYITESGLARGDDPGSARVMANLLAFGRKSGQMGAGAFKTAQRAVRNLEVGQWLREPPRKETEHWAAEIALGRKTIEDFNAAAAYTASHRFPHMAEQIKAGMTVSEIIGPQVEAYAREMDWDAQGLMSKMYSNPSFGGLTGIRDPKSGQMRLPTEYEARTMARQRGDWWQTTGGRQADAQMATALLEMFGKRG